MMINDIDTIDHHLLLKLSQASLSGDWLLHRHSLPAIATAPDIQIDTPHTQETFGKFSVTQTVPSLVAPNVEIS